LNTVDGGIAMTVTPNDDIHILYGDSCGGIPVACNMDSIRSSDAGANWTGAVNVATGAQFYMDIAASEDGNLHALYRDTATLNSWYEDTNVNYKMSSNNGSSWSSSQTAYRSTGYLLTDYMASPGVHPYSIDMLWANWPQIGGDRTNVPDDGFVANIGVRWPYQEEYAIDLLNTTVNEYYGQIILYNSTLNEVPEISPEQFILIVLVVTLVTLFIHRRNRRQKEFWKS
jgi:hypothetical protein